MTIREEDAVGLIVDDGGRLLLQLRDERPGRINANRWGFFGGHVEPGESARDAFVREMREELGWQPRHFEHWTTRDVDEDGWHVRSHAFAAHLDVPLDALTLGEGQRMALFAPDALPPETIPGAARLIAEFARTDAYKRVRRTWAALTATALLFDRDGRFLLQHRDDKPGIANPGRWGSFGGEIEPYETPEEGFLRELDEELGFKPARYELYASFPFASEMGRILVYVFAALVDVPERQLVLGEGQGMGFFPPDALPDAVVPEYAALIRQFVESETYRRLRTDD
jgi:ADP-ribose pyrophosphatase YjhB (NUDIX family)